MAASLEKKNKAPVIGVTPSYDCDKKQVFLRHNYLTPIMDQGGIPMVLPMTEDEKILREAAELCDGFYFTGGVDLHPARYGEDTLQACETVIPLRDEMELLLMKIAMESGKPIFGICRGIQTLNVALGGTLYQDIALQTASRLCHAQHPPYNFGIHRVQIEKDSLLYKILGKDTTMVNSTHHQAVKDAAASLAIGAVAPDGVIECIWRPESRFFLGVQWHPEHLYETTEDARKIFAAFVDACRE